MPKTEFLQRRTNHCRGCPLYKTKGVQTCHVPTELVIHDPKKPVTKIFVGEAPGEDEDAQGRPFVGRTGSLFRKVAFKIQEAMDKKENFAIANMVRCRPSDKDGKNRQPTNDERNHCKQYLIEDINRIKPDLVVGMGGIAVGGFIDGFRSVASIRGVPQRVKNDIDGYDIKLFPTYHPSAVARNPYLLSYYREDLHRAFDKHRMDKWSKKGKVKTLDTVELVRKFVKYLQKGLKPDDIVAFDVESKEGLNRVSNSLTSISFAITGKKGFVIPLDHPKAPWSPEEYKEVKKLLRSLFKDEVSFGHWAAHNAKFDMQQVHLMFGVWIQNAPVIDTMFIMFLLDENRLTLKKQLGSCYGLKQLVYEYMGFDHYADEIFDKGEDGGAMGLYRLSLKSRRYYRKFLDYNAMDSYVTRRLIDYAKFRAGDYSKKMMRLAKKLGSKASFMFANAEYNGFAVDVEQLSRLKGKHSPIDQAMEKIEEWFKNFKPAQRVNKKLAQVQSGSMNPLFGMPWVFNLRKKDHQLKLFIHELGLAPVSEGKDGVPSIDKEFIREYAASIPDDIKSEEDIQKYLDNQEPAAQALYYFGEHTGLYKLKTSYLDSVSWFVKHSPECKDGRVRSSFGMTDVVTGRTNSKDPNLQQVPKGDSEYKRAIKNLYMAGPGRVLVSADYTQGEVYLLAQVAKDKDFAKLLWKMREIRQNYFKHQTEEWGKRVKEECDIHRQTAAMMYGLAVSKVSKKERQSAKSIVFGLVYGQHVRTLAANLGITEEEAQKLVDKFFSKFPASYRWLKEIEKFAEVHHFVESPTHRRRRFPQLMSGDDTEKNRALRQARNSPIQSLLSDFTLYSAARLQELINKYHLDWKIVDVVHDAIVADIPFNQVRQYAMMTESIMTDTKQFAKDFHIKMLVPMAVDFEFGTHYGELEEWGIGEKSMESILERVEKKWTSKGYPIKHTRQIKLWDEKGRTTKDYIKYVQAANEKMHKHKKAA